MLLSAVRRRWPDVVWLVVLCVYILEGVPTASFHGDESMLIHMSRDYATTFIEGSPEQLLSSGPFPIDSDPHLRVINGSMTRYTVGLAWHLAGYSADDLPPAPGWDWGLTYDAGIATGHRPDDALLYVARWPSALFLCASVVVLHALGWLYGGRLPAFVASGLYALHPVILLNGRRVMQESPMLFFGLLMVLCTAVLVRRLAQGERTAWGWWALLVASGGLTLASKHSGIVFVGTALLWLLLAGAMSSRPWQRIFGRVFVSGALIVVLFVALSPALWLDPPARLGDLLALRGELIRIQASIDPNAPMDLSQRVVEIIRQPFIAPAAHYELSTWTVSAAYMDEVRRSAASPLAGLPFRLLLGVPLTALAAVGVMVAVRWARQPLYAGLLVWLAVNCVVLLVNPLPWQRYYIALIPVAITLVAIAVNMLVARWLHPST